MILLIFLIVSGFARGNFGQNIIHIDGECEVTFNVLLDCSSVDGDDQTIFDVQNVNSEIIKVDFFRLRGHVDLRNLPEVDTIDVLIGDARCEQIINTKTVTLRLQQMSLICMQKDEGLTFTTGGSTARDKSFIIKDGTTIDSTITTRAPTTRDLSITTRVPTTKDLSITSRDDTTMEAPTTTYDSATDDSIDGKVIITVLPGCISLIIIIIFIIILYRKRCFKCKICRKRGDIEMIGMSSLERLSDASADGSIVLFETPIHGGAYKTD